MNSATTFRRILVLLIGCTLAAATLRAGQPASRKTNMNEKPNVVVILMDDLGWGDLGSYGAVDARTPNLDRLAREGARLTDCYAAAPVCTPTRAAFMTGRYQHRVGLETVIAPSIGNMDKGLPQSVRALPRLMKEAGYRTALIGKWHLGSTPDSLPRRHGFDEFFGFLGGAIDHYSHHGEVHDKDLYENETPANVEGYITDLITERAIAFIERNASRPFFVDVSYSAPHWPFQPPGAGPTNVAASVKGGQRLRVWAEEGTRADYVRMVESADAGIGRILLALERLDPARNTLVIFTSDNGGEWLSRMGPFFNRKGTLWEGGIRVPCILRWPGHIPAKQVSAQPAITMDLTATILAAAGVSSVKPPLDGIDLVPLLAAGSTPVERSLFWRSPGGPNGEKAVRSGNWKYVARDPLFPGLLFDLENDPGERNDV
ncbi:MAG TPA: sulfatase-like hydrolase/transferase, partial [Thermoanaerobaculia bacterium]